MTAANEGTEPSQLTYRYLGALSMMFVIAAQVGRLVFEDGGGWNVAILVAAVFLLGIAIAGIVKERRKR